MSYVQFKHIPAWFARMWFHDRLPELYVIDPFRILQEESTIVRDAPFVVQSAGMTTSHRTGSTFSGKLSEIKVVIIDVFPTRASGNEQNLVLRSPITIIRMLFCVLLCIRRSKLDSRISKNNVQIQEIATRTKPLSCKPPRHREQKCTSGACCYRRCRSDASSDPP